MKTIVLSGFLGAGKTTIVLQLARYLVGDVPAPNKVVILENEIGQVGVDDLVLKGNGYQVSELFAGCACCTSSGELRGNVRVIQRDLQTEWMIVEATGLAYPLRIKESLDPILDSPAVICTLVDAQRFLRMLLPARDLIDGQLSDAAMVLINKVDLVEPETLEKVEEAVKARSPRAVHHRVCGLREIDDAIWAELTAQCL